MPCECAGQHGRLRICKTGFNSSAGFLNRRPEIGVMLRQDMYLPAVLSVIYGNERPKDAIRCVEAGRCNSGEVEGNERGADA